MSESVEVSDPDLLNRYFLVNLPVLEIPKTAHYALRFGLSLRLDVFVRLAADMQFRQTNSAQSFAQGTLQIIEFVFSVGQKSLPFPPVLRYIEIEAWSDVQR